MSISSAFYETKVCIKDQDNSVISSGNSLKMLGFNFGNTPSVQPQLDYLIRKASKRYFLLLHYKRSGIPTDKLKDIYCAITRSVIEYSSVVYHSQLNTGQSNELEKIQKRCLRVIYGYEHQYQDLPTMSGLPSLEDRRTKAFQKFARNTLENPKYSHWFPAKNQTRDTRSVAKFKEEKAIGNRLYNSPVFAMRRFLNRTETPDIPDLTGLFNNP